MLPGRWCTLRNDFCRQVCIKECTTVYISVFLSGSEQRYPSIVSHTMMLSADTLDEDRHYSNQNMGHRLADMCVSQSFGGRKRRKNTKPKVQRHPLPSPATEVTMVNQFLLFAFLIGASQDKAYKISGVSRISNDMSTKFVEPSPRPDISMRLLFVTETCDGVRHDIGTMAMCVRGIIRSLFRILMRFVLYPSSLSWP